VNPCRNGHDQDEVGVYRYTRKNGHTRSECRACNRDARIRYKQSKGESTLIYLDPTPLLDAVMASNMAIDYLPYGIQRALYRARRDGRITLFQADEVSCAIGLHPVEVFGSAFFTAEPVRARVYR
jgi:hypothetical protein